MWRNAQMKRERRMATYQSCITSSVLGQIRHLPSLATTAIPEDLRVAERREPKCQVAPIKALRVPTDCNDRLIEIATGQLDHLAAQAILRLVGKAAAQTGEFEPDSLQGSTGPTSSRPCR